jgi:hypothetical protein
MAIWAHFLLVSFLLVALYALEVWNDTNVGALAAAAIFDFYRAMPKSSFISMGVIPAMFAGMTCRRHHGGLLHMALVAMYCGIIASIPLLGSGFSLVQGIVASSTAVVGYYVGKHNKTVRSSADASST